MTVPYHDQVSEAFRLTPPEAFGDSHATWAELGALRALHKWNGGDREATLRDIATHGYPTPDEITPDMIALSGAAHACGVTEHLAESRGVEGKETTYESYTIKNRFDRFVRKHLPEHLRTEWADPIDREEGFTNDTVSYPEGVDTTKIHGGALPHRFLPAQTMRYLEFARLGKLDAKTREEWQIDDKTGLDKFRVEWDELIPRIESSKTLLDLTGNIADGIASELQNSGLSDELIVSVLKKGFSTEGMTAEHGEFEVIEKYQ